MIILLGLRVYQNNIVYSDFWNVPHRQSNVFAYILWRHILGMCSGSSFMYRELEPCFVVTSTSQPALGYTFSDSKLILLPMEVHHAFYDL